MKVYAISDIHTDYPENLEWIRGLSREEFGGDALIVAGDVSDDEKTFVETFAHLSRTFRHVFFVAGNHELYLRKGTRRAEEGEGGEGGGGGGGAGGGEEGGGGEAERQEAPASSECLAPGDGGGDEAGPPGSPPRPLRKYRDSVEKLAAITADLAALGVRTTPTLLDGAEAAPSSPSGRQQKAGVEEEEKKKEKRKKRRRRTSTPVWIVPILSWYHSAFDTEPRIPSFDADPRRIYTDFKACRWPSDLDPLVLNDGGDALAAFFDSLNDPQLASLSRSLSSSPSSPSSTSEEGRPSSSSSSSSPPPRPVVLAFSHFLPFLELLPEKRFVTAPNLASVAGSRRLGRRVEGLRPDIHVFGHTHIPFDGQLPSIVALGAAGAEEGGRSREGSREGGGGEEEEALAAKTLPTRFVQAPLRYPAERRRSREGKGGSSGSPTRSRSYELQLIWDCGGGEESGSESESEEEHGEERETPKIVVTRGRPGPTRSAFWTEYYENNARDPGNLELAPWVRPRVERYRNL